MAMLQQRGWDPSLLVFAPIGEMLRPRLQGQWRQRHRAVRDFGLNVSQLPSPPSRNRVLWSELPLLRLWLRRRFGRNPNVVIHCRGYVATRLALDVKVTLPELKIVFDCRGLNGAEYAYVRGYASIEEAPELIAREAERIEWVEKGVALDADHMICVSNAMKQVVTKRWGVTGDKISVVPCCTDREAGTKAIKNREATRQRLGLSDRLVIVYCGSLEAWQVPETCLSWFNRIATLRANAHLLAITTHPERMVAFADAAGVPEASRTVISVSQNEVSRYLAAADCGLLIRERSVVNHVASPVKFAEYLAAGVPVLISEEVGDYSDIIRLEGFGSVLYETCSMEQAMRSLDDFLSRLESEDRFKMAGRCAAYLADHLNWESMIGRLEAVYDDLTNLR